MLGQALTSDEVKLEAAEVADVHHIIARGQMFPPALLAVSAKVASKPFVQAAVLEALRQDYMLVDVPGGAAIPVFRDESGGSEGENEQAEGVPQLDARREDGRESAASMRQLALASSASAPTALSSLRQRRGKNNQLAPVGTVQQESELAVSAVQDQEAVFAQAEQRLRRWGNAWQPLADSQLSSLSSCSTPPNQLSARNTPVDIVTPVGSVADVVTPLPPIELLSPHLADVAAQSAPRPGMLEWLLQWLDSKISGILGVLVPPSASSLASSAPAQAQRECAAVPYRLEASAAPSSSPSASSSSLSSAATAHGAQVVAGVAAVVIVLALVRRTSPALFALVAKLLHG